MDRAPYHYGARSHTQFLSRLATKLGVTKLFNDVYLNFAAN